MKGTSDWKSMKGEEAWLGTEGDGAPSGRVTGRINMGEGVCLNTNYYSKTYRSLSMSALLSLPNYLRFSRAGGTVRYLKVKALAAKPEGLSSNPRTHVVQELTSARFSLTSTGVLPWVAFVYTQPCACMYTHTHSQHIIFPLLQRDKSCMLAGDKVEGREWET